MNTTLTAETVETLVTIKPHTCGECGVVFGMSEEFKAARVRDHRTWYCPNGHGRVFAGETQEQKLKRQLEAARDDSRWYRDQLHASERSKAALKGHLTRARNKIATGTCPVPDCGLHFSNVREHMRHKHPDWHLTDPETGEAAVL